MITASKNGVTRIFDDFQWKNMPKDKFGWKTVSETDPQTEIPKDIIQKKMIAGAVVDAVRPVPDEIIVKKSVETRPNNSEDGQQLNDDLPPAKRKPGRQPK